MHLMPPSCTPTRRSISTAMNVVVVAVALFGALFVFVRVVVAVASAAGERRVGGGDGGTRSGGPALLRPTSGHGHGALGLNGLSLSGHCAREEGRRLSRISMPCVLYSSLGLLLVGLHDPCRLLYFANVCPALFALATRTRPRLRLPLFVGSGLCAYIPAFISGCVHRRVRAHGSRLSSLLWLDRQGWRPHAARTTYAISV
jgi:hypothetical protein